MSDDRALSSYAFNEYEDARLYNGIHDLETAIETLRADLRHAVDCDGWRGGPNALHNEPCPKCAEIRKRITSKTGVE